MHDLLQNILPVVAMLRKKGMQEEEHSVAASPTSTTHS
jgi:hypothetical protein